MTSANKHYYVQPNAFISIYVSISMDTNKSCVQTEPNVSRRNSVNYGKRNRCGFFYGKTQNTVLGNGMIWNETQSWAAGTVRKAKHVLGVEDWSGSAVYGGQTDKSSTSYWRQIHEGRGCKRSFLGGIRARWKKWKKRRREKTRRSCGEKSQLISAYGVEKTQTNSVVAALDLDGHDSDDQWNPNNNNQSLFQQLFYFRGLFTIRSQVQ